MSSTLVYGANKNKRDEVISKMLGNLGIKESSNNPDLLLIKKPNDKKSTGIKQVRECNKFLSERPFSSKNKAIVIDRAETLTVQAQNALLKTLEEHPSFAQIILSSKTQSSLLDTVLSRCKKIRVDIPTVSSDNSHHPRTPTRSDGFTNDSTDTAHTIKINNLLKKSKGQRLVEIENLAKKDSAEITGTLEHWIFDLRKNLNEKSAKDIAENIEVIEKISNDIKNTNVNKKLALENLVLKMN